MAQINVNNLTFGYEGSFDNIFENISFSIDTNWKLGFVGRNGKGKSTFLNLLLGKYTYSGSITYNQKFDYFPYCINQDELEFTAFDLFEKWKPGIESWKVFCELPDLNVDTELLYRPIKTLSFGERTKIMLAVLFSSDNEFLLIDEPTNHLDYESREIVKKYLSSKKGFILVSHDRNLLDECVDHMLVLNRSTIEVVAGNFSSWWENKNRADAFAIDENRKHLKEIAKLKNAADRATRWAIKNENTKIGFDPVKEHDRCLSTRSYIGAKTKKMQSRVTSFENRIEKEIKEKENLLCDIEQTIDLKINPLKHIKNTLVNVMELSAFYDDSKNTLFNDLRFQINQGDIAFIKGNNGSGKSSLVKAILANAGYDNLITGGLPNTLGTLETASNLIISYINQDTSHLKGKLKDYANLNNLDETLLLTLLNQLDFDRVQYSKNIEDFSEGQKKKVLIASSLITPAHLYIWDEPMNYIDVFSRIQIEKLIAKYRPTMIIIEHDVRFCENIGNKVINLK